MAVVKQPVEKRRGQRAVAGQCLIPTAEVEIGCQDDGATLIDFGDDLKDQMSLVALQRQDNRSHR